MSVRIATGHQGGGVLSDTKVIEGGKTFEQGEVEWLIERLANVV